MIEGCPVAPSLFPSSSSQPKPFTVLASRLLTVVLGLDNVVTPITDLRVEDSPERNMNNELTSQPSSICGDDSEEVDCYIVVGVVSVSWASNNHQSTFRGSGCFDG